ncbi:MAG TPA: PIN domain-containing protein [Nitrososphaerales archaeon]
MKWKLVIDAGALTLFYAGDLRVKPYFEQVKDKKTEGYITSVNLAEYYYKACQKLGKDIADLRYHQSRTILTVIDSYEGLVAVAGFAKCRHNALSLADCFALALTKMINGILLTSDSELAKVKGITAKHFAIDIIRQ